MQKLVIKLLRAVVIKSQGAHSRVMVLLSPRLDRDISGGLSLHVQTENTCLFPYMIRL